MTADPLFWLFVIFTVIVVYGFHWGRRENERIFRVAMGDLMEVLKPQDQTFTNIGGFVGYHARFIMPKSSMVEKGEATITFLPRHAWLYYPFSRLWRHYDRLFVTLHLRKPLPGEGHLIEKRYAHFRHAKITGEENLSREEVKWGPLDFFLYYENPRIKWQLKSIVELTPDPGTIRHFALLGGEKRCFVFLIPTKQGTVKRDLTLLCNFVFNEIFGKGEEKWR